MYEYDPVTRKYRRKRAPEEVARAQKSTEMPPASEPGVPAEKNPAYAIRDEEGINFKPPPPPGATPGKIIFWGVFAVIFCGWIYFMYTMYVKDLKREPRDLGALIEAQQEFEEIMNLEPSLRPDDIEVDITGVVSNRTPAIPANAYSPAELPRTVPERLSVPAQ